MEESQKIDQKTTEEYDSLQTHFNKNNIYKIQYISESYTSNRFDVFKNYLRKNTENYVLIPHKNCIVMPGPKRNKIENPPGLVIAYNSGYIISIGNRPGTVGIDSGSDNSIQYADWVRKKFRSHNCDPLCKSLNNTKLLNVLGRVDFSNNSEFFLEELHDFLITNFPHWKIIYDPEVAPYMVVTRISDGRSSSNTRIFFPELLKKKYRWPSDKAIQEFQNRETSLMKQKESNGFMKSVMILGPKHIVVHQINSKKELEKAVNELLPLLLHFIDSPENRWTCKKGD